MIMVRIGAAIIITVIIATGNTMATAPEMQQEQIESIEPLPSPTVAPTDAPKTKNKKMVVTATAYCACEKCCGKSDGITATGTKATQGRTIAVDPKQIPLGSKIIIDGKEYVAEDTGGSIISNRIDIYFENHKQALDFGKKTKEIEILEEIK